MHNLHTSNVEQLTDYCLKNTVLSLPRVHTRFRLGPMIGRTTTRNSLCRFDFWFIFGNNDGHTVHCNFPGLCTAPIDVFQSRGVPAFLHRFFVFFLSFLITRGRKKLTGYLLCYQLRIYPRFPCRCALSNVAHQAFERFRRVPERTYAAIPEIILQHLGRTLSSSDRTLFIIHFRHKHFKNNYFGAN